MTPAEPHRRVVASHALRLGATALLCAVTWWSSGQIGRAVALGGLVWCAARLWELEGVAPRLPSAWTSRLAWAVPPFLLLALGAWLYGGLLSNAPPVGADHTPHLFHAMVMSEHLLPHAQLTGWSNLQFAGGPEFTLYGPGPYVLMALIDWLGGDAVTITAAYNVVLVAFLIGLPLVVYAVMVDYGSPRLAAFLAACLLLVDRGVYDEGGWEQHVVSGVWPSSFAMMWVALALIPLRRAMHGGGPKAALALALCTAAALLSHPVSLVCFVVVLVPWAAVYVRSRPGLFWCAVGLACGGLLAAFWLWPWLGLREEMLPQGELWVEAVEAGRRLVAGELLHNLWPFVWGLGLVGALLGFKARAPGHRFALMLAVFAAVVASRGVWDALHAERYASYQHMNFPRLLPLVRIPLIAAASYALAYGVSQVRWRTLAQTPRSLFAGAVLLALVAPHVARGVSTELLEPVRKLRPASEQEGWADVEAAYAFLRQRKAEDPAFFRVLAVEGRDARCAHRLPVETGLGVAHLGGKPTFHHYHRFYDHRPDVLRKLSVRYVLACGTRPGVAGARKVWGQGAVTIAELPDWRPEPWNLTAGSADVQTRVYQDERVELDVSAPSGNARLQLAVVGSPRWRATLDGQPLPITLTGLSPSTVPFFMEVALPAAGRLVFSYEDDHRMSVGRVMSGLGLLAFLALLVAWRRQSTTRAVGR